jgi:hypothetical protein
LTIKGFEGLGLSFDEGHPVYSMSRTNRALSEAMEELAPKDLLEKIYGTNKYFVACRGENGIEVKVRDYDPGY